MVPQPCDDPMFQGGKYFADPHLLLQQLCYSILVSGSVESSNRVESDPKDLVVS